MTDDAAAQQPAPRRIRVWDAPVRLFHWALALLVLGNYLTGEIGGFDFTMPGSGAFVANMDLHTWGGLSILTLILFRIAWGFSGSTTARFSDFVAGPAAVIGYLSRLIKGSGTFTAGHNPAGGAMTVAMLALVLAQACTGLFAKADDFFGTTGPLNGLVSEAAAEMITTFHHRNWSVIEALVIVHILANLFYLIFRKENLIGAMFTGRKTLPGDAPAPALRFAPPWRAALLLAAAACLVWLTIAVFGE